MRPTSKFQDNLWPVIKVCIKKATTILLKIEFEHAVKFAEHAVKNFFSRPTLELRIPRMGSPFWGER